MTSRAVPTRAGWFHAPPVVMALFALLGVTGYWMLFTTLPAYDDEGYILISAREQSRTGGLYNAVYSQYGPAFYVLTDAIQGVLGKPFTHHGARWLTLALWLGTAGACTAFVHRLTGARSLALFTAASTFLYLYFIPDEPFHPGTLIIFLLASVVYAHAIASDTGAWQRAGWLAGATGAVLLLCKVNVGAFFAVAVVVWGAAHATSDRLRRGAAFVGPWLIVALAVGLMRPLWSEPWVWTYLGVFAVGALTVCRSLQPEALLTAKSVRALLLGGFITAGAIIGVACGRGTTLFALIDGILLEPMRHAARYSYAVDWRPGTLAFAALSLAAFVLHAVLLRRGATAAADRLLLGLRAVQMIALLIGIVLLMEARVIGAIFSYLAPSIWIWTIPLAGAATVPAISRLRGFLALVLLLQYLHAFPIGGIQESWGTFLFMPLVALGLDEVRRWLNARGPTTSSALLRWTTLAVVIAGVAVGKSLWVAQRAHTRHAARADLELPGAELLRLPEAQRTAYRILSLNAAVHADLLFSLPGMFSFNLWTGLPTPTQRNTTVWFTLLSETDQRAIIARLEQTPRSCVVVEERLLHLMNQIGVPVQGALHAYLQQHFAPVFRLDGFALHARRSATIATLNIAEIIPKSAAAPGAAANPQVVFRLVGDGRPIAAIEAAPLMDTPSRGLALNAGNTTVTVTPIDRAGRPVRIGQVMPWPLTITGLATVALTFDPALTALPAGTTIFYLKGAHGENVGEVRLPE